MYQDRGALYQNATHGRYLCTGARYARPVPYKMHNPVMQLSCQGPIVNNLTGVPGKKGVENGVGPSSTTPAKYRPLFLRHISTL